jgi:hypothetical protein
MVGEPRDLAVRDALAISDDPPEVALGGENLRHSAESI